MITTENPAILIRSTAGVVRPPSNSRKADVATPRLDRKPPRHRTMRLFLISVVVGLGFWCFTQWGVSKGTTLELLTAVVKRGSLPITVLARGELESAKSEDVHCEVEGSQIRVVRIMPEGTSVTKGTVVIEFDTKELDSSISEREKSLNTAKNNASTARKEVDMEKNRCESLINRAERELQKAKMNRDKYLDPKGEYQVQVEDLRTGLAEIEKDLTGAQGKLELYRKSYKRGFSSAEQVRLKEQEVERLERRLDRDRAKLYLLENFTRNQMEAELKGQADDASMELERTKHNCEIALARVEANANAAEELVTMETDLLEKLRRQRQLCTIRAPQDGILIYAKDSDFDSTSRIKQGAVVFNNQKLFSLPDLAHMQVNVRIHESKVKKIAIGQSAEIRIDGYPLLHGTVMRRGALPDPNGFLNGSGVKEYVSVVNIHDLPQGAKLLPRMSAEVRILVDEIPDALLVPLQSVTETSGQYFCYVVESEGIQRRAVTVGESNERFIEIKNGLAVGEQVTLDARVRIASELKKSDGGGRSLSGSFEPKLKTSPHDQPALNDANAVSDSVGSAPTMSDQEHLRHMFGGSSPSAAPQVRPTGNEPLLQSGSMP